MEKIVIKKDCIIFNDKKLFPPFDKSELEETFGKPEIHKINNEELNYHSTISVWNNYGIAGYLCNDNNTYKTLLIRISSEEVFNDIITGVFNGEIYVENKLYTECKWKEDIIASHVLKKGCFELSTFIANEIDKVPDKFKNFAIKMSRLFEIAYIEPTIKSTKYTLKKISEPVLKISDFNFKLAVIQVLMYEKNQLLPRFNAYEFAKKYKKRKIDIDEEGYEPIKEIVNWFKKIEIPVSLVSYIDEITMDGGNEIYTQIIPFWDGEDDYFDIKNITEDEIKQFSNLKKITLLPSKNNPKIIEKLKNYGIEADEL